MVKSRSRSPRWKPGPLPHKSPEYNRHRQDYDHNNHGFHRNPRRPMQWDTERQRQNNFRNDMYHKFSDDMHEQGLIDSEFKRPPFEATNNMRRTYSPGRQGESNRRYSAKYNEVSDYREYSRNFHDDRIHERNRHNNNAHNNDFKPGRRWGSFGRPHSREHDRDWHESDVHWNEYDHPEQYSSPLRRRPQEYEERESFQKRYPEDDYREYEQPHKRAREAGRHDYYQPPCRSSHWKDEHPEGQYYGRDWTKEVDYRHSNPNIHEKQSGHKTTEYDYSPRSPSYRHPEPVFSNDHASKYNRHEERKLAHARTSQNHRTDGGGKERRRYHDGSLESLSKSSSRKADGRNDVKNDTNVKHLNHKQGDKGRKEEYPRKKEDQCRKDPNSTRPSRPQTPDPKVVLKIAPVKEAIDNFGVKKSTDKYRPPHELKSTSKDLPPKSEAAQEPRTSEGKRVLGDDLKKRNSSTSKDRQTSHDLVVVGGKERFNPAFGEQQQSAHSGANAPSTEFAQEIITIIHEVKANHFKSSGLSLHERFTKLPTESNEQELNFENSKLKSNPEIHRRIDISLEELLKKSLHKTVEVQSASNKIADPNDLRHDIERRRKERLHSDQNGTDEASFANSDISGSHHRPRNREDKELISSSRERRSSLQDSTRRLPETDSYYRGNSSKYYTSRSHLKDSSETRRPYKKWGDPAARI